MKSLAWGDGKPETVSPPSRAAWIEIRCSKQRRKDEEVAAFTGGVD